MNHDPIDSLIYLTRTIETSLDALSETMSERLGYEDENEDVDLLNKWLEGVKKEIATEAATHYDGRKQYSTGVPFLKGYEYPTSEPGENGEIVLVTGEAWVDMHPDGTPEEPLDKRGTWMTKTRP